MKLFVKGDIDGLFAMGLDNLIMLLLMNFLCLTVLGFDPELFFFRILPANAVGLIIGNLYYSRMALRLGRAEGRTDVCALPYGINLFTIIVFSYGVMLPVKIQAMDGGMDAAAAAHLAWTAGILAAVGSGFVEFIGAFQAKLIRRFTPRAALLAAIGGIGFFFIGADYFFRAFNYPLVGIPTLLLTLIIYFGRLQFRGGLPAGLVIVVTGMALAWAQYGITGSGVVSGFNPDWSLIGIHLPVPALSELVGALPFLLPYLPLILTMGFISLTGSLMNLESAAAAGDDYPTTPALVFNGLGSMATGFFGSPFPTTLYIGHPGWKQLGARAGYSTLNAIVFTLILCSGTLGIVVQLIPIEAGMAILIWIGLMMASQAFDAVPRSHIPAVATGFLPVVAAFAYYIASSTWRALGYFPGGKELPPDTTPFVASGLYMDGIFTLNAGYIYTCVVLTAIVVGIIENRFRVAALWALIGAGLSAIGFIHAFSYGADGYRDILAPRWDWVLYYTIAAAILVVAPFLTRENGRMS